MSNKTIKPTHFVAIGPGEWFKAGALDLAVKGVRKRLGAKLAKTATLTIFASTAPMTLEFDVYVRVQAEPDHPLVQFDLDA